MDIAVSIAENAERQLPQCCFCMSFGAYAESRTAKGGLTHRVIGYTTVKTEGSMRWEGEYRDKDEDLCSWCLSGGGFLNVDSTSATRPDEYI